MSCKKLTNYNRLFFSRSTMIGKLSLDSSCSWPINNRRHFVTMRVLATCDDSGTDIEKPKRARGEPNFTEVSQWRYARAEEIRRWKEARAVFLVRQRNCLQVLWSHAYSKMSYAYLFKYIIIGDTGKNTQCIIPRWQWSRNEFLIPIASASSATRAHCFRSRAYRDTSYL